MHFRLKIYRILLNHRRLKTRRNAVDRCICGGGIRGERGKRVGCGKRRLEGSLKCRVSIGCAGNQTKLRKRSAKDILVKRLSRGARMIDAVTPSQNQSI